MKRAYALVHGRCRQVRAPGACLAATCIHAHTCLAIPMPRACVPATLPSMMTKSGRAIATHRKVR